MTPKETYAAKLKDPRWQRLRLKVFERDGWACQECRATHKTLHVHHLHYRPGTEPWEYPLSVLQTLCEDCHAAESEKRPAPKRPDPSERRTVYARLLAIIDLGRPREGVPCEVLMAWQSPGPCSHLNVYPLDLSAGSWLRAHLEPLLGRRLAGGEGVDLRSVLGCWAVLAVAGPRVERVDCVIPAMPPEVFVPSPQPFAWAITDGGLPDCDWLSPHAGSRIRERISRSLDYRRLAVTVPKSPELPPGLAGLCVGAFVQHEAFGVGRVFELHGEGALARAHVRFAQGGEKVLVLTHAKLIVLSVPQPNLPPQL